MGYYASYANIPIFTDSGTNPLLGNKQIYDTLIRVSPTYNQFGRAFHEIFKYFKWKLVMVSLYLLLTWPGNLTLVKIRVWKVTFVKYCNTEVQ